MYDHYSITNHVITTRCQHHVFWVELNALNWTIMVSIKNAYLELKKLIQANRQNPYRNFIVTQVDLVTLWPDSACQTCIRPSVEPLKTN